MPNKNNPMPDWLMEILNYLNGRKDKNKYRLLLESPFGINGLKEDSANEGFGFQLGFLFSDGVVSPKQICLYLGRYEIIKEVAQEHLLDLIGLERPTKAVPYREDLPLDTLGIGYIGRRPNIQDIERIFTAYDTIEARLKEL